MNIQNPSALARVRTRMSLIVGRLQPLGRQVRVHLGGAQRLVAQQLLHAAKVSAILKQARRKAVSQGVWANLGVKARFLEIVVKVTTNRAAAYPPAVPVLRTAAWWSLPRPTGRQSAHHREP